MKSLKFTLLLMLAAVTLFSSCVNENNTNYVQRNKVVILNAGNYTERNGSVYVYDEDTKEMIPNAYAKANNGTKLGAAIMSGTFSSAGAGYLLCANPDKIETVNILTMKSLGAYNKELKNPREIAVGGNYLYVTNAGEEFIDLGNGFKEYNKSYVSVYDISAHMPNHVANIAVGSDAQGLICFDDKIFVGTKDGIVIIENDNGHLTKRYTYTDEEYTGPVKYLCAGKDVIYASVPSAGGIMAYDPYDERVRERFQMPLDYDGYITSDMNGNVYSFATDYETRTSGAYKLTPNSKDLLKVMPGMYIYSVGVSPYSGCLFTSEVNDFVTNSTMTVTNMQNDTHIASKTTGVGTFRYMFISYLDIDNTQPAE